MGQQPLVAPRKPGDLLPDGLELAALWRKEPQGVPQGGEGLDWTGNLDPWNPGILDWWVPWAHEALGPAPPGPLGALANSSALGSHGAPMAPGGLCNQSSQIICSHRNRLPENS